MDAGTIDSPCLFTGEHPFVHIDPSGESIGFGVMTAEQLYLPTSPTQAVVLSHPWTSWPEAPVEGTMEMATRLNWAMLTHPSNEELLLHPDVPGHPLPSPGLLARNSVWPWGRGSRGEARTAKRIKAPGFVVRCMERLPAAPS